MVGDPRSRVSKTVRSLAVSRTEEESLPSSKQSLLLVVSMGEEEGFRVRRERSQAVEELNVR